MNALMKSYWEDTLIVLEKHFNEAVFNSTIKKLEPLYIDELLFVLKTDLDFYKTTIEQRHLHKIQNVLRAVTEREFTVKIVSPEDFLNKNKNGNAQSIRDILKACNLQSKYVFETFVRGKSNELAYAAAVAVADAPGQTTYNPLFLYGGVGLGKTHLMHSIGNYIIEQNPDTKVLYVSTETFTNELINSLKEHKNQEFRNKYRDKDVLLIDDIQFLSEKESTQEEFFHTFNTLYNANKQIVISSDQPPKELRTLTERLKSRFGCGLTVDITLPDLETRIAILHKKCDIDRIDISQEVTNYIAKNIFSNIRDLEGALTKVSAYSKLSSREITLELAEHALSDLISKNQKPEISVDLIMQVVADYYKISVDDMKGKKRTQRIAYPRQIAMFLSRKLLDFSLPALGVLFDRDHSTISHGCDKITEDIETTPALRQVVIDLETRIRG